MAQLQIVDCLEPGKIRRLGNTEYLTPRKPSRVTAAECRVRGGEYTAFDRANYKSALSIWMPEAEAGNAAAQNHVGVIYEKGLGGEPDYKAAALWYERAAEKGNAEAQFNLGTLYEQGLGVEKDKLKALNWYRKASGIPLDSLIYQSAADHQARDMRRDLENSIRQRDARIKILERDLEELKSREVITGSHGQERQAEIDELEQWVATLQRERSESAARLAEVPAPRLRQPQARLARADTRSPGASISSDGIEFGQYYALIIGIQSYTKMDSLDTPKNDASKMAALLKQKYGFNVEILLDADRISVMEKINDLSDQLQENDNLLIYYAGHGARKKTGDHENGYWLPIDADAPPRDTFWVSNEFITGHLARIKARRVMVVADSCYAGLLSDAPGYLMLEGGPQYTREFLEYKLPKRSRLLLSSGGDKPVLDNGAPGHSVFAAVLLEALEQNDQILSGPQLFTAISQQVKERSAASGFAQSAEYKVIKGAGHEVGDFFFVPI